MDYDLETIGVYGHGRDKKKRPVVIINVRQVLDLEEDLMGVLDIVLGHAVMNAMVPGRVEQLMLIINAMDLKVWEVPIYLFKAFEEYGSAFFRRRIYQFKIINAHWTVLTAIKIVNTFLDHFQLQQLE